jgi:hypothetical protein
MFKIHIHLLHIHIQPSLKSTIEKAPNLPMLNNQLLGKLRPPRGLYMVNCDDAVGFGAIIRDSNGFVVSACNIIQNSITDPLAAKA